MAETSYMARFGVRLVTNGYGILPIGPGTKKPGQFKRGAWADYPEWNRHTERPTTEVEVTTWATWPECGIGLVGGAVAAVDIDVVEDAELALQIEKLARVRLGDTPALRIGKAPKRMLIYRTETPFRGIKRHPLEVLCLGQQFVAYANHPDTGAPYAWPEEGLADLDITELPEITAEMAHAFLDEAYAVLPEHLRQRGLATGSPATEHLQAHSQMGTLPAIEAALKWLPNAELDYDSWVRIGMGLKGALGDAGGDIFAGWSAQAAKDVPAVTAKAWASFKPDRIGAGTIYHLAMERGWQPDAALRFDGSMACDEQHPAADLLSKLGEHSAFDEEPPATLPFTLVMPDGLVGDLTDYMLSTARRPQPLLSLGASLCAIGALSRAEPCPSRPGADRPRPVRLHRRRPAQTPIHRCRPVGAPARGRVMPATQSFFTEHGDHFMPYPENTPTLDDLPSLSAAEVAALPVELLAILQREIDERLKRDKAAKTRFDAGLAVRYPGIRFESLAVRVAERDLRALSAPILSGEITVSRAGANLDPGDVIALSNPRRGLEGVVVRIVEIDHGDGRANGVRLKIAEDVFGLGETALVGGESGDPGSLILPPKPLTRRWVAEAPYWLLVQELGHAQADALLEEDPDAGAIVAAGERPSADALSAQVWSDSGAGYTLEEAVEFVPTALLVSEVSDDPAESVLTVGNWTGLGDVGCCTFLGQVAGRVGWLRDDFHADHIYRTRGRHQTRRKFLQLCDRVEFAK